MRAKQRVCAWVLVSEMNKIERVRRTSSEREREREAERERVTEKAGNIVRDGGKVEIDRYR